MHLTHLTTGKRHGFKGKALHRKRDVRIHPIVYLKQKSSFLMASLSLVAFVAGNMIGTHGVYAFWKSVWGKYDDSLIAYTGTVMPIAKVPDYECWSRLGGGGDDHTYRQVPQQCLVALEPYDLQKQRAGEQRNYEVGYMGDYESGHDGEGSHPGVDIRAPKGTPVLAVANGIVTSVREDRGGFGRLIVLRIPHAPDPGNPAKTTVLHAAYAHLDAQLVAEGDIVQKGQVIAYSGGTGYVTGYHLHFQLDRDAFPDGSEVPWHPYWPFTANQAREAGMSLAQAIDSGLRQEEGYRATINPMLYVQANYSPVQVVADGSASAAASSAASLSPAEREEQMRARLISMRELRRERRLSRLKTEVAAASSASPIVINVAPPEHAAASAAPVAMPEDTGIQTIEISHDRSFAGRGWETVTVTLLDAAGNAVDGSKLTRDLHLRTAYGEAEFRPQILSALDFHGGRAEVNMLPRGRRTIVVTVQPFGALSEPMRFEE